jgi:phage/plasmid-like protein (TIGR03299 family)
MSHEIEEINGVAQMAYAGAIPWHGLGTAVSNDLSPIQMMQKSGLDWSVEEVDSYVKYQGKEIPTGEKALVRDLDNKILTNVGKGWNPVQNEQAFEFFHEFCLAGDMEMHTAGSLDGGRRVFVLAKVKESFEILGGDKVDSYLLFSNPHMYGRAIDVRFTPVRVVCNNTLSMSLSQNSKNQVKLNHRSKFDSNRVKETLGIASEKFGQYKEVAEFLAKKRFDHDNMIQYFDQVFPHTYRKGVEVKTEADLTKNAKLAVGVMNSQPGAQYGEGSFWQLLNSVTYLTDHQMGRSVDSRMNSAWYGANQVRKVKALNLAVEMADAA